MQIETVIETVSVVITLVYVGILVSTTMERLPTRSWLEQAEESLMETALQMKLLLIVVAILSVLALFLLVTTLIPVGDIHNSMLSIFAGTFFYFCGTVMRPTPYLGLSNSGLLKQQLKRLGIFLILFGIFLQSPVLPIVRGLLQN